MYSTIFLPGINPTCASYIMLVMTFYILVVSTLEISLYSTVQQAIGLYSFTVNRLSLFGITVTTVQFIALYIFLVKNFFTTSITSSLIMCWDFLKILHCSHQFRGLYHHLWNPIPLEFLLPLHTNQVSAGGIAHILSSY